MAYNANVPMGRGGVEGKGKNEEEARSSRLPVGQGMAGELGLVAFSHGPSPLPQFQCQTRILMPW